MPNTWCLPHVQDTHRCCTAAVLLLLLLPRQALLLHLYQCVLGPYWAERRRLVEAGYRGIEPGTQHFGLVLRRELQTQQQQTVDDLVRRCCTLLLGRGSTTNLQQGGGDA
jgi:hypothetical protein